MRISANRVLGFGLLSLSTCDSVVEGWGEGLPWTDLINALSPSAELLDTGPADYLAQCTAELDLSIFERDHYALIDQPSGLCMNTLFCAFESCYPDPDAASTSILQRLGNWPASFLANYSSLDPQIRAWTDDVSNPRFNLPSKVLFPVVASDVVAAVAFAKEHGLEISVKNSGHSYVGASTKKDTLHINMNRYTNYAPSSVTICDADNSVIDPETLDGQPCALSMAKNKPAVLRVGGGENWDKTYRAVKAFNGAQPKYHIVGGAAGTVSPMGWAFQGGLAGTSAGRIYGFGVDQLNQIEMVLPNGQHVRFGPTEWEDVPDSVPRTTKVSGVCRSNPMERDENQWEWAACPVDPPINFDDLWFAVRGGGGGTWGVVLSLYYQLHPTLSLEYLKMVPYPAESLAGLDPTQLEILNTAYDKFEILFLVGPESIGVGPNISNACARPLGRFEFDCYGVGSAGAFDASWRRYLNESIRETLLAEGIPALVIDASVDCTECSSVDKYIDYASAPHNLFPKGHRFEGLATDDEVYIPLKTETLANVIIPTDWIINNFDRAVKIFPKRFSYYAFGGRTAGATSDQANSLSRAHRDGGFMSGFALGEGLDLGEGLPLYNDTFFSDIFPEFYDTSDPENFPGYIGSNHAVPTIMGPLKDDWTKACPIEWTEAERDEKCISLQEAIYGTKVLTRLEAIKESVDPDFMFDCYKCIGNNRAKPVAAAPEAEDEATEPDHKEGEDHDNHEEGDHDHDHSDNSGASGMVHISAYRIMVLIVGSVFFG